MKNAIASYLKFIGFQTLSRELFRGIMRADPKRHAQYIAILNYQIDIEMKLYERMHRQTPKTAESETVDPT